MKDGLPYEFIAHRVKIGWVEDVKTGRMPEREMWAMVLGTLQVQGEEIVPRQAFIRWIEDLVHHITRYTEFVNAMTSMWGTRVKTSPTDDRLWSGIL